MAESQTCPYCGSPVTEPRVLQSEESLNVRCYKCGRIFEYIPGFGTFTVSESDSGVEVSRGPTYQRMTEEGIAPPQRPSNCSTLACTMCCMCLLMTLIPFVMFYFLGMFP